MSDYSKVKLTPEYREARREVEMMIDQKLKPLLTKLDEIGKAVIDLEKRVPTVEGQRPKV